MALWLASMSRTIALIGALDTKGAEYDFVRSLIEARGHKTLLIDVGILGEPAVKPDITRFEVAAAAGADVKSLAAAKDRGAAVAAMEQGAAIVAAKLHAEGRFDGILGLGGSGGTTVATGAMRALPVGVPKVMVSTVAGTDVSGYVGVKDVTMMPSIVDVSGVNRISRVIFARAAGAVCGMVETEIPPGEDKPLIAASMFGNTTDTVEAARKELEAAGYEVIVFHATGTGGRVMESLIAEGHVEAVLDITTTEWADELVGGVLGAGPTRLGAAAARGVPAVVVPGCIDMVNFGAPETVPARFEGRTFYRHNPHVTLMRTNAEECRRLGGIFAEKLNASSAPVTVLIPTRGYSQIGAPDGPFADRTADEAFATALKSGLNDEIEVVEMDNNINDPAFAARCAAALLANIQTARA